MQVSWTIPQDVCQLCGYERHKSKEDISACHETTAKKRCTYTYCAGEKAPQGPHQIRVCIALHSRCIVCGCRGHAAGCFDDAAFQARFEEFAKHIARGLFTRLALPHNDGRRPQPHWGFFPVASWRLAAGFLAFRNPYAKLLSLGQDQLNAPVNALAVLGWILHETERLRGISLVTWPEKVHHELTQRQAARREEKARDKKGQAKADEKSHAGGHRSRSKVKSGPGGKRQATRSPSSPPPVPAGKKSASRGRHQGPRSAPGTSRGSSAGRNPPPAKK